MGYINYWLREPPEEDECEYNIDGTRVNPYEEEY
jgi:hypothetical protein